MTASLIIGSVPAVLVGSLLSSSVPDRYVRPVIAFVIFASGLKYVGLSTTALGWALCGVLLAAAIAWMVLARPWRRGAGRRRRPSMRPTSRQSKHPPTSSARSAASPAAG